MHSDPPTFPMMATDEDGRTVLILDRQTTCPTCGKACAIVVNWGGVTRCSDCSATTRAAAHPSRDTQGAP